MCQPTPFTPRMSPLPVSQRLAVCSWSLHPANPIELIDHLRLIGIHRIQLALDPLRNSPAMWGDIAALCNQENMTLVSGMCGCVGEDYSTLETIRETGGIVRDSTWDENWSNMEVAAAIASQLGLTLVTFHAGFLPHAVDDPDYGKLQNRLRQLADLFATRNITLALETGQETAHTLRDFLQALNRPNVGVNFDPANMILYGKGNPVEAVQVLGPWVRQAHIKDAVATQVPGAWGREVVVGTGQVDWSAFFATLTQSGFEGDYCIEREAGEERVADICTARECAETLDL